jgi:hypothetical protein
MTTLTGVMELTVVLEGVIDVSTGEPPPVSDDYLLDFSDEDMSMYLGVI